MYFLASVAISARSARSYGRAKFSLERTERAEIATEARKYTQKQAKSSMTAQQKLFLAF